MMRFSGYYGHRPSKSNEHASTLDSIYLYE
jgi:hypothetical protein